LSTLIGKSALTGNTIFTNTLATSIDPVKTGHLQQLLHLTKAQKVPVARSTYSDTLNSGARQVIVQLPDRLAQFDELEDRPV